MEVPALADETDGCALDESSSARPGSFAALRPDRLVMPKAVKRRGLERRRVSEERRVGRIGAGPAAFDVVDAELRRARARWCACPRRRNRRPASARHRAASCRRDRRAPWRSSLDLPGRARGPVLEHDALGGELVADAIGLRRSSSPCALRCARRSHARSLPGRRSVSSAITILHAGKAQKGRSPTGQCDVRRICAAQQSRAACSDRRQAQQETSSPTRGAAIGSATPYQRSRVVALSFSPCTVQSIGCR